MATSKPAIDTAPKRSSNPKPRTPPAMPATTTVRKPETTCTRRNISAPVPLSPSSTKRSTAISSKPVTSNTSRVITPKPKKNPSLAVAPSKDRVHSTRAHKDGVLSPKPPSPKPRTESATTRAGTGVRTSARVVNASAPVRGRSPVTGTKPVSKVGAAAAKPASKRSPSVGAKTGTRGSLTRVNSAPNLLKEAANVHEEKVPDVPVEEEKITYGSPDIENKDEQTEPIPVPVPVPVPSSMEEQVKEEHVYVGIENDGQSETYAENDVHEDDEELTDEVTSEPATAEPVPIQTIPVPDVSVPEVLIPDAPVPVVPAPAAQVAPAAATVTAHGKKEAGTSNAAIEETRSKLIGERKSKVLALVGAFESVM